VRVGGGGGEARRAPGRVGGRSRATPRARAAAGVAGFAAGSAAAARVLETLGACALDADCVAPPGARPDNHRYDQSALTLSAWMHVRPRPAPAPANPPQPRPPAQPGTRTSPPVPVTGTGGRQGVDCIDDRRLRAYLRVDGRPSVPLGPDFPSQPEPSEGPVRRPPAPAEDGPVGADGRSSRATGAGDSGDHSASGAAGHGVALVLARRRHPHKPYKGSVRAVPEKTK
jgi:hypothetical protein